mgnify:CR=1 FL=1
MRYLKSVLLQVVILVLVSLWLLPIYLMVLDGLKSTSSVLLTPILSPGGISPSAFVSTACDLARPILNSLVVTVPVAAIGTYFGALAAFSFYRYTSKISDILFSIIALATFVPFESVTLPLAKLIFSMNLFDSYLGLIFAFLIFYLPTGALLMSIFLVSLPKPVLEAARADGAGDWIVFNKVVLPLMMPGMISTFIFIFIEVWNNFFIPLVLIKSPDMRTATLAAMRYIGGMGVLYNDTFAASFIISLVPLLVFIFTGKYFIRGLLVIGGGTKG